MCFYGTLLATFVASAMLVPYFIYSLIGINVHFPDSTLCNVYCRQLLEGPVFEHQIVINETKLALPAGRLTIGVEGSSVLALRHFDSNCATSATLSTTTSLLTTNESLFIPSTSLEGLEYSEFYNFSTEVAGFVSGECVELDPSLPKEIAVVEPGCRVELDFADDVSITYLVLDAPETADPWHQLLVVDIQDVSSPVNITLNFRPKYAVDGAIGGGIVGLLMFAVFLILFVRFLKKCSEEISDCSDVAYFLWPGCCEDVIEDYDAT